MPCFWIKTSDVCGPYASGEEELRAFLGDNYSPDAAELAREWAETGRKTPEQVEQFYRSTHGYLYDLTQWHGSKRFPYAEVISDFAGARGFRHLLDFGCGIGTDGLKLLARGFRVTFYDFRNASTEYLQWRLKNRGLKATILYAGEDELPKNDLTYAIDVIEHLPDPAATLKQLAALTTTLVPHFPITTQADKYPMHFPLDKRQLRSVVRQQGFRRVRPLLSQLRYKWGLLLSLLESPDFWVAE